MIVPYTIADTTGADASTAYDSIWTAQAAAQPAASTLERNMLADDKLGVVVVVLSIIWLGLLLYVWRTDAKLARLEQALKGVDNADFVESQSSQSNE
jgi:CcmD family protein